MPNQVAYNRIKEASNTVGTGNFTLAGAEIGGYQTFNSKVGVGPSTFYVIQNTGASEWEVGVGHLSNSTTLVRDFVEDSSNAGSLVNFSGGNKDVFLDLPASAVPVVQNNGDATKQVHFDASGLTTGNTRLLSVPDQNGTLALLERAQTFIANQTIHAKEAIGSSATIDTSIAGIVPTVLTLSETFNVNSLVYCESINLIIDPHSGGNSIGIGTAIQVQTSNISTNNFLSLNGYFGEVDHLGSGNFNGMIGVQGRAQNKGTGSGSFIEGGDFTTYNYVSGTVSGAWGLYIEAANLGTGIITTSYGLQAFIYNSGGGTVTTSYGINVNVTGAITNYAFYSDSGITKHIAGNAAEEVLILKGAASQSANLQANENSSGTFLSGINAAGEYILKTGAGAPVDTPVDGATYIDITNSKLYVRVSGAWKSATLT